MRADIDLGDGRALRFVPWQPDRRLSVNRERFRDLPDVPRYGAVISHASARGTDCETFVVFDTAETRAIDEAFVLRRQGARMTVEQWDPLTIAQLVQCYCGDRGYVRAGQWVRG